MKRLILMRHAKSDWSGGEASDHERGLNQRGQRSAAALGDWLRGEALTPDEVLCSTATRTRETLARLLLDADTKTRFLRELYLAPQQAILSSLRQAGGRCVLVLGHNPGIGQAASAFLKTGCENANFPRYPTGATLVADFTIDTWLDADWGQAVAQHFVVPRDL